MLPQTGLPDALGVAERLRKVIAQTTLPLFDGQILRFTVSIGVGAGAAQTITLQELLKIADRAVCRRVGRNQVISYQDLTPDVAQTGG